MKKEDYESLSKERNDLKLMLQKGTKHRVKLEHRLKEIRGLLKEAHRSNYHETEQ